MSSVFCFQDWKFVANDYTFTDTVYGIPQPYGQAKDCASEIRGCHFATMKVNLTKSGFTLHSEVYTSTCSSNGSFYSDHFVSEKVLLCMTWGGAVIWFWWNLYTTSLHIHIYMIPCLRNKKSWGLIKWPPYDCYGYIQHFLWPTSWNPIVK